MDPLFPELPEKIEDATDEALADLLKEHEVAAEKLEAGDPEYTKDLSADELIAGLEVGIEQIEAIKAEQQRRVEAEEAYQARVSELAARRKGEPAEDEEPTPEPDPEPEPEPEPEVASAESEDLADEEPAVDEEPAAEEEEVEEVEDSKKVTASAVALRRPPAATGERKGKEGGAVLTAAAGQVGIRGGSTLDRMALADTYRKVAGSVGAPAKSANGVEQKFLVASAAFKFPAERILAPGETDANAKKIRQVIPAGIPGIFGMVASGGLCAPLENVYSLVNFASSARPVRDALPSFQAERGGVNVPESSYIADITSAISLITVDEDALGGTFATKSCQDLDCADYNETAVTVISHCREYGNLNARAWPEKIAHENDLTMAAHARTAETYLLDRIKAQSLNVTQAALGATMNAFAGLANAILKTRASIQYNLRSDQNARYRVLMPAWIGDLLAADSALTQFDGQQAAAALTSKLQQYGISIAYYLDAPTGSDKFSAEVDSTTVDDFPDHVEYALFPEGAFIHVDSGVLELGLVRDSTLNSTNDFQLFGESFENVARLAPLQATRWVTQVVCPNGVFPALGTAPTC
jgi:outer membrane biosynthesis protein TonB